MKKFLWAVLGFCLIVQFIWPPKTEIGESIMFVSCFVSILSIMGAPFLCLLFASFIVVSEELEDMEYDRERWHVSAAVVKGIPIIAFFMMVVDFLRIMIIG